MFKERGFLIIGDYFVLLASNTGGTVAEAASTIVITIFAKNKYFVDCGQNMYLLALALQYT